jgi:hypothetical protein
MSEDETHGNAKAVEEAAATDHESVSGSVPGREGGPHDSDDMAAAEGLSTPPETERAYEEMLERGKNQKGEGRIS